MITISFRICDHLRHRAENTGAIHSARFTAHCIQEAFHTPAGGLQVRPQQKGVFRPHKPQPGIGGVRVSRVRPQGQDYNGGPVSADHLPCPVL